MAEIRRTTIPQFTIRGLLLATALMAVVSLAVSHALRGTAWVGGVAVGLAALVVSFAIYVMMFAIISLVAGLFARRSAASDQRPSSATRNALLVLIAVGALAIATRPACATSGGVLVLPRLAPGEIDKTGGLMLTVNLNWVDSCGYRPVRIELKSLPGPVKADRVLTLRFRPKQAYTRFDSVAAMQVLELPEGSSSTTAVLSVPQLGPWGMFEIDVLENGEYVKQLSIGQNGGWASWSGTTRGDSASPVVLLLSGADTLTGAFMVNNPTELIYVQPDNPSATIDPQIANSAPNLGVGSPLTGTASSAPTFAELPTKWIDYTGFDVMIVSLAKLETLATNHKAQWSAIRDWLHNGGNLVVYGVGKKWEELDKLERLLGLEDRSKRDSSEEIDLPAHGWELPRESLRRAGLIDPVASEGAVAVGEPQSSVILETTGNGAANELGAANLPTGRGNNSLQPDTVPSDRARFVVRRCGLGVVAAIASTDQFDQGEKFPWHWLYNTMGASQWQWSARNGVTIYGANDNFWNFLIPGVGLVPVTSFQILITLFVVVIGPVNYYLLRRWGKLNLTVLTVPAGALVLTAALLLYALVSDGLSVRLRARSITHLDQRTGEATCWSRLSYYAGLAPAGGLAFSGDTAVYPLEMLPVASMEGGPRRDVDWVRSDPARPDSPLVQRLPEGWLNSRTPTQLITARIRKSAVGLGIQPGSGGDRPQVKNHLGSSIVKLMLTDGDGKTFTASNIPDGALAKFDDAASPDALLELFGSNQPQVPTARAEANHSGFFGLNRRRPYYQSGVYMTPGYVSPNSPAYNVTPQNGGMLERSLGEINAAIAAGRLPPRTYVAVVERSPEFQPGTQLATEEASFHVVVGNW